MVNAMINMTAGNYVWQVYSTVTWIPKPAAPLPIELVDLF